MPEKFGSAAEIAAQFDAVLHKNADRVAGGCDAHRVHTPLDALIAQEVEAGIDPEGEKECDQSHIIRQEIFRALMGYFFADGCHPLDVQRRVYAVAKAVDPGLIMDMSLEDLAALCLDGGRATTSARIKRIYNKFIEKNGGGKVNAHFQKSPETVKKYAKAQQGNHNRAKSVRRKRKK